MSPLPPPPPPQPDPRTIARAADRLRSGGLVAFPTETVYGLGADALNAEAVRRVFAAKGRPTNNPLIVHVDGTAMARRVCAAWSDDAEALAAAFWPGPLTIVVAASADVPREVTAGGTTVAVRAPRHETALALIGVFGGPIVGPSANRSGRVSPTSAEHVRAEFAEVDDAKSVLVLDGGACKAGVESTVVDPGETAAGRPAVVLRRGVVGAEAIARVLGREVRVAEDDAADAEGVERSPGRLGPHYRPAAPVVVVANAGAAAAVAEQAVGEPPSVVVLSVDEPVGTAPRRAVWLAMPGDAAGYARRLYAALREADQHRPGLIVVVEPWPRDGAGLGEADAAVWAAVRERLGRAASRDA